MGWTGSASCCSTRTNSCSSTEVRPRPSIGACHETRRPDDAGPIDAPRLPARRRLRPARDRGRRSPAARRAPGGGPPGRSRGRPARTSRPKARHVIHIFLGGGLSHVDSFDYKPELEAYHGRDLPAEIGKADVFFGKVGRLHRSHYPFQRRGRSGLWVSDLFPHIAGVADELTVINSMVAESANHIPAIFQANTGFRQMGFPAMGSWLSYGLGTENEDLPGFVVLPDARGIPNSAGGAFNWTSGFLPAEHQGVAFNTKGGPPIRDLRPSGRVSREAQRAGWSCWRRSTRSTSKGAPRPTR